MFFSLADFISLSTFIGNTLASEPVSNLIRTLFPCTFITACHFCSVLVERFLSVTVPQRDICCYHHCCQHALSQLDILFFVYFPPRHTFARSGSCLYISNIILHTTDTCVADAGCHNIHSYCLDGTVCVAYVPQSCPLADSFPGCTTFLCSLTCFF